MKNKFCFESELLKDIIISLIDIQDKELKNLGYGSFEKLPIIKKSILNYFNDEMFKKCYIAITSNSQNPYEIFNNILLAIIKDLVELSELDKFRLENFINRNMLLYPNCIIVRDDENNIIFIIKFVGIEYKIKIPNSTNINNINGRSGELSVWGAEITEEKFPKLLDDNLHFKHYGNILSLSKLYLAQTTNNTYPTLLAKIGGYYYYIRLVADILSNEFIIPGTNLKVEKCNAVIINDTFR